MTIPSRSFLKVRISVFSPELDDAFATLFLMDRDIDCFQRDPRHLKTSSFVKALARRCVPIGANDESNEVWSWWQRLFCESGEVGFFFC